VNSELFPASGPLIVSHLGLAQHNQGAYDSASTEVQRLYGIVEK